MKKVYQHIIYFGSVVLFAIALALPLASPSVPANDITISPGILCVGETGSGNACGGG